MVLKKFDLFHFW